MNLKYFYQLNSYFRIPCHPQTPSVLISKIIFLNSEVYIYFFQCEHVQVHFLPD